MMKIVDQQEDQEAFSRDGTRIHSHQYEESRTDALSKIVHQSRMPVSKDPTTIMLDGMGGFTICLITASITNVLENGLVAARMSELIGDVSVTALSPDRVTVSDDDQSRLNVFLYRVSPNLGIRKPSKIADTNVSVPTFVLDLSYLITAYGAQDFHTEILLGYTMQKMAQIPMISSSMFQDVINVKGRSNRSVFASGLIKQWTSKNAKTWDSVKVTPQFVNTEEMSRLWSALQDRFRPSVVYQVSGVKIYGQEQQECT
ncbi:MAG: hypothetical protein NPIRA04_04700 [Nitrospirales bacterium]|nr:MAG: hypothetical protein NPIRA04_04700 [Nitrospirales bacterium]